MVTAVSKERNRRLLSRSKNCRTLVWSGVRITLGTQKIGGGVFLGALLRVGRWGVGSAHSGRRWRGRRDSRVCGYGIRRGDGKGCSFPFFFLFLASLFMLPICWCRQFFPFFPPFCGGIFFPFGFGSRVQEEEQTNNGSSELAGGHASGRACAASSSPSPSFPSPPLSSCFRVSVLQQQIC